LRQQRLDLAPQCLITRAGFRQKRGARINRPRQRRVIEPIDRFPLIGAQRHDLKTGAL